MIDPVALSAEISSGPLRKEISPFVAAGNDNAVAEILNRKDYRGPVPIIDVSAYCTVNGITGAVEAAAHDNTNDIGVRQVCFGALSVLRNDLRLNVADLDHPAFTAITGALIASGLMTHDQGIQIFALANNRYSRAEVLWGAGTNVSNGDVARAFGRV